MKDIAESNTSASVIVLPMLLQKDDHLYNSNKRDDFNFKNLLTDAVSDCSLYVMYLFFKC